MTLGFRHSPEQRANLDRLLGELQNPASASYHKWLTPEEFGKRFGPTENQLNEAEAWLRDQGFTIEGVARGRGWITFSGTVGGAQQAFQTAIHRYRSGGKTHFGPESAPALPPEIARITGAIRGLDDFYLQPSPHAMPLYTASDGTHALAPGDVAQIYGINYACCGKTSPIAVAGESGVNLSDIRLFRSTFQLPANDPQIILVGTDPGIDRSGPYQEAEADVEWAGALAPLSHIIYVYAQDVFVAAQNVIDQNLASILTFSFGACEPNVAPGDAEFIQGLAQQGNAEGITWIASSGDAGPAACDANTKQATNGLAVSFPASLPEVTGVGGTEFDEGNSGWNSNNGPNLSSVITHLPETSWNDTSASGLAASGGGPSVLFAKPDWQAAPGVPNDGARDVPDVALTASPHHDPYIVMMDGQTYAAGGTSVAAPVFAGMVSLFGQVADGPAGALLGFGNLNPALYSAAEDLVIPAFHDITTGDNVVPCAAGSKDCVNGSMGYSAGPGYDLVTGLGSVDGFGFYAHVKVSTNVALTISSTQIPQGQQLTLTATAHAANGGVLVGLVTFADSFTPVPTYRALDSTGTATITLLPSAGTHTFTASFVPNFSGCCVAVAGSASAAVTVVVTPAPPQMPALAGPASGSTDAALSVVLTWTGVPFATSYDVYFGTTPSPPFWGNVTSTQCTAALTSNTTYYWKVAARNGFGVSPSAVQSFSTTGQGYSISTIAGSTNAGFSPDGTLARQALISAPSDVALDGKGNLYFTDAGNGLVRMINAAGILSTVAGGGTGGDGGPATSAKLYPTAIALDGQGNLYISEALTATGISSVRMVSPAGIISTIAGGTTTGDSGDGGPATSAKLGQPNGLAVDHAGNVFIAEVTGCVRKISGGIISTVAGVCGYGAMSGAGDGDGGPATQAWLSGPTGVAVDSAGIIYIADYGDCRIRKVTAGVITTLIGPPGDNQGCLDSLGFGWGQIQPRRVTLDASGTIYFTSNVEDGEAAVFRYVDGVLTPIGGGGQINPGEGGPGTAAFVGGAQGLAVDQAGRVYFANSDSTYRGSQTIRLLVPASAYTAPAPVITANGIVSAANYGAPIAPGSIAAVFGNLGYSSAAEAGSTPLPTTLTGLSIEFQTSGGVVPAPLFYASPGQINMQIPWELAGQSSASVRAVLNGNEGPVQTLPLATYAPGIFTVGSPTLGAIVDTNGVLISGANPTTTGAVIEIFCTGLGPVMNQPATGSPASLTSLSQTPETPTATIGGIPATVLFSGLAPGAVGEYQVNVQVPAGLPKGSPPVPLSLSIGGVNANSVMIAVQ